MLLFKNIEVNFIKRGLLFFSRYIYIYINIHKEWQFSKYKKINRSFKGLFGSGVLEGRGGEVR
jgi:uncharacterized membrane protein